MSEPAAGAGAVRTRGGPARPAVDGKFFQVAGQRFHMRGVTYGTFAAGPLGLFPDLEQVKRDFVAMAEAGVNTVRTYTVPEPPVLDLAGECGLRLLLGVWWEDPRYLESPSAQAWRDMAAHARAAVGQAVASAAGHEAVLGFVVGNEIPGPVVRWHGRRRVEGLLRSLHQAGKEADPQVLLGYANYPTTAYLDTSWFDFECWNVFLEDEAAYRRYLAQLQVASGDRPVVLAEVGLDSATHGEPRQAEVLDWQLGAAIEHGLAGTCVFAWTDDWWVAGDRVEDWSFGVTDADRRPKAALATMAHRYRNGVRGCREDWPGISVVVCAYNEEATIEECLASLGELDYPTYEVVVVDDGSTDATAELARPFPVLLLSRGRRGLGGARNLGLDHARHEVVAYIDADARADPDWLTYLALGLEAPDAAGVGGPNLVPPEDPPTAQCIGRSPGGPAHVLVDDERAEHVPGCNMAFRRQRLLEIGGFDPVYRSAGDDVDVCWKLADLGYTIRFHPAAIVWHHPRQRVGAFWRQQLGYGRAEALVARNHPDKVNHLGQARWQGTIYGPAPLLAGRSVVYSGRFGNAPFQRLYRGSPGVPVVALAYSAAALAALGLAAPHLAALSAAGASAGLGGLCLAQGVRVARREGLHPWWKRGSLIGLLHLLQPLAREAGRLRCRHLSFPPAHAARRRFPALRRSGRRRFVAQGVAEADRDAYLEELVERLRASRLRVAPAPPWGLSDLQCRSARFWEASLVSYAQWDQLHLRLAPRPRPAVAALVVLPALAAVTRSRALAVTSAATAAVAGAERWRFERLVRRALEAG